MPWGISAIAREADLERVFVRGVRLLGGITIKITPYVVGIPDRLVLLPPPHTPASYLVELKAEGERPTPAQLAWHAKAAAIGHPVVVLVGRAEIEAWLLALDLASTRPN